MKCPYCGKTECEKRQDKSSYKGVTFKTEFWFCKNCEEEFADGEMVHNNISNYKRKKDEEKRFILYLLRWQLSTPILAACLTFLNFGTLMNSIIANLVGGLIFFWIDGWIFKDKSKNVEEKILPDEIVKCCFGSMKQKFDYEYDKEHYNLFNKGE